MDLNTIRQQANLEALKGRDADVVSLICTAAHVVLYEFKDANWSKKDIEGSLFIVQRCTTPFFQLIVLNRKGQGGDYCDDCSRARISDSDPYLMYRSKGGEVLGIWFYDAAERSRVADVLAQVPRLVTIQQQQAAQREALLLQQQRAAAAAAAATAAATVPRTPSAGAALTLADIEGGGNSGGNSGGSGGGGGTSLLTLLHGAKSAPSSPVTSASPPTKAAPMTTSKISSSSASAGAAQQLVDAVDRASLGEPLSRFDFQRRLFALFDEPGFVDALYESYLRKRTGK